MVRPRRRHRPQPREVLINAVLGEDVPDGMGWGHYIWCVYWTSISRCRGARSPDPVRRSQGMINQWFPRIEPMPESMLQRLITAHEDSRMVGWDFSRLGGRLVTDEPDWEFDAMCVEAMSAAESVLDMGTGGGERLLVLLEQLGGASLTVAATEGWTPNIAVAREALGPLGIEVAEYDNENGVPMPFPSATFDLVLAAHESFDAHEVARVLRPGGRLLTQQVDGRDAEELRDWFGGPPAYPGVSLHHYSAAAESAGLTIESQGEWSGSMRFSDAGALVEYMGLVPWDVPGFTVAPHVQKLMELDANRPIVVTQRRFWLAAHKAAVQSSRGRHPQQWTPPGEVAGHLPGACSTKEKT